jgi:CubicO group peptidase (beta-lactamase class C family)
VTEGGRTFRSGAWSAGGRTFRSGARPGLKPRPPARAPALLGILAVALATSVLVAQSGAPPLPAAKPAAVGLDAAKLAQAVDLYKQAVATGGIKGAVLYVARHGKVALWEAVGWRHEAYQLPMQKDTLFRMASNTKPLIATSVLMLAEQGKLAVTDRVSKYLPSFDNDKSRAITIEQLLSHSSGFRIQPIFFPFQPGETPTLQSAVTRFGAEGPAAPPGSFSYSNAGFNTLGAVIEVVSGEPLERFLTEHIYQPLGMTDSLNHEDPAKLARMATVYTGRRRNGQLTFTQGFTPGDPPDYPFVRASGGLISSAADYARFLEAWLERGSYAGHRLVGPESVKVATSAHATIDGTSSYGLGWFVDADGTFNHTGSDGTMGWVDQQRDIIGMVLTQSPGGDNPTKQLRQLIADAVR